MYHALTSNISEMVSAMYLDLGKAQMELVKGNIQRKNAQLACR